MQNMQLVELGERRMGDGSWSFGSLREKKRSINLALMFFWRTSRPCDAHGKYLSQDRTTMVPIALIPFFQIAVVR